MEFVANKPQLIIFMDVGQVGFNVTEVSTVNVEGRNIIGQQATLYVPLKALCAAISLQCLIYTCVQVLCTKNS